MRDAPLNPTIWNSKIIIEVNQSNWTAQLNELVKQALQFLGVFPWYPLTLISDNKISFTKLPTSTRTSFHLNIEGPPDQTSGSDFFLGSQQNFQPKFAPRKIRTAPQQKWTPRNKKKHVHHESHSLFFLKLTVSGMFFFFGILTIPVFGTSSGSIGKWIKWWKWDLPGFRRRHSFRGGSLLELWRLIFTEIFPEIFEKKSAPQQSF